MKKHYNGPVTQLVDMLHRAIYTLSNIWIYLIAISGNRVFFFSLKVRLNVESTFCSLMHDYTTQQI